MSACCAETEFWNAPVGDANVYLPLGGGQGLPGLPLSIRPHRVAAVVRVTEATPVRAAR